MEKVCDCGNRKFDKNVSAISKNIIIHTCKNCGHIYEWHKKQRKFIQI